MDDQMEKLVQKMKTTAYGDIVPSEQEQIRRIKKAQEVGLIKPIPMKTPLEELNADNYDERTHKIYKQLAYQVQKNHEELLKLGIPEEKLSPFLAKKLEEASEMSHLYRKYDLPQRIQPNEIQLNPEADYRMKLLQIGPALNIKPEDLPE